MSTHYPKKDASDRQWHVIDCNDQVLGRLASEIASILRGKHQATYAPHIDNGDFVVALNAAKVKLTGKKWEDKMYWRYSGHPGGLRGESAENLAGRHPERLLQKAVRGMLPKTILGQQLIKKLKICTGADNRYAAQCQATATTEAS